MMNTSGDAAEQIVRLYLEGFEVAAKITGSGAKNIAALLYAIMKDRTKTAGKTKLVNMLKSGKELKIFSVKQSEFKKFTEEAKRYGVLYSALINKKSKSNDGIIDIMVKAEDAAKINRIVKRFKMSSYDEATIRSEIEKNKNQKDEKAIDGKMTTDNEKDKVLELNESQKKEQMLNPQLAMTEKSPQSELSSKMLNTSVQGTRINKKTSVKEKLEKAKLDAKNQNKSKVKTEVSKGKVLNKKESKSKNR